MAPINKNFDVIVEEYIEVIEEIIANETISTNGTDTNTTDPDANSTTPVTNETVIEIGEDDQSVVDNGTIITPNGTNETEVVIDPPNPLPDYKPKKPNKLKPLIPDW